MVEQVFQNPKKWPVLNGGVTLGQLSTLAFGGRTKGSLWLVECLESLFRGLDQSQVCRGIRPHRCLGETFCAQPVSQDNKGLRR